MRKHLKNWTIPHADNEYRPHTFRKVGVRTVSLLAVAVLGISLLYTYVLPRSSFLAAVIPEVLIDLTNNDRLANGRNQVTHNPVLTYAAQLKANHMAENGYFAHNSPDGVTPWFWFAEAGYQFATAGENLAVHFTDSEEVADAWMNSPGHRANILNNNFTEIGIATARGRYQGQSTLFVVQMFGAPAYGSVASVSTSSEPDPEPEPIEAEPAEQEPEEAEVIVVEETETFIAVEVEDYADVDEAVGEVIVEDEPADAIGLLEPQSSPIERALASPYHIVQWAYLILMLFIVIVLILTVVIEFEKQHPKNVLYGVGLLILVVVLLYVTRMYVFTDASII